MKNVLLIGMALVIGLAVVAQKPQVRADIKLKNLSKEQKITNEPFEKMTSPVTTKRSWKSAASPNIVSIIDIGTSANVLGYSSGSRPMLWADDDLNAVINFHRAGPGSTPASLSGYYAMDLAINMGMTEDDWNSQIIVSNAILVSSPYYYDASRYPCAGIFNPVGNTSLSNAYCAFMGPNFCNLSTSGFGGYTYGRANLVDFTDTTKHLLWYTPPLGTYIPAGYYVCNESQTAHSIDGDQMQPDGTLAYQDQIIYGRGVWNATDKDFDYTFTTIPMPCKESYGEADEEIAASPDGQRMWMSVLTNYAGAVAPNPAPILDSIYYPLVRYSDDAGLTWSDPIPVILDGPNGIDGIKNAYSDYFIENFFLPPLPTRDEIPYTTAFDHGLAVDKWGNPHIAVAVSYTNGGYTISTGVDSLINVFDIFSQDNGLTWQAVRVGSLTTFRGTFGDYSCDNRVYIGRDKTGEHMFITWNDTKLEGVTDNQNPDVFARGFDLLNNKLTNDNGTDSYTNVTFLCDITQEAYWQCTSPIVFTDNNKYTIPVATQYFTDPAGSAQFKYIPDFSFTDADFTIPVTTTPFQVGIEKKNSNLASVQIAPNPVKDLAKVTVTLSQNADVTITVTNLVGQQVMTLDKGNMNTGTQVFTLSTNGLKSGAYFVTVNANGQKFTEKMIVE